MHVERLLENLTEDLKLEAVPQKNKEGIYQLKFPPDFQIGISELNPGIFFSSPRSNEDEGVKRGAVGFVCRRQLPCYDI